MNDELQKHARSCLKEGLGKCTDGEKLKFKRLYANGSLGLSVNDVVDLMEADKLDWAMQQVQRTLDKK